MVAKGLRALMRAIRRSAISAWAAASYDEEALLYCLAFAKETSHNHLKQFNGKGLS